MRWDLRPLMSTTKPTPQASCSNAGSYKPCLGGKPVQRGRLPSVLLISPRPVFNSRALIRSAYTAPGSVKVLIQQDSAARLRTADARCKERFAGSLLNTTRRIDRILQRSTPASMRAPVRVADLPLAPLAHQDQIEVLQVG